jgi:hypothetical protein
MSRFESVQRFHDRGTRADPRRCCDIGRPADGNASPGRLFHRCLPDSLSDAVRADVLPAVDRANAAWVAATQLLDPSELDGAVAGQELTVDRDEVHALRGQGQSHTDVNTAFSVTDVAIDAPGHAIVHTHETWYAEIHDAARLIQATAPTTHDETCTVEFHDGGWIVTRNVT